MNIYLKKALYFFATTVKYFCLFFTVFLLHDVFDPADYQTPEWLVNSLHSFHYYLPTLVGAVIITSAEIWKYGWSRKPSEFKIA